MLGELTPCGGGPPIPLLKPKLLVGRHPRCDLPLPFSTVSGRHCELELIGGYWVVRDLSSHNGTQVNGVACQTKRLMPGDILSVARHRYTIVYTPQGEQPAPEPDEDLYGFSGSLLEKAGVAPELLASGAAGSAMPVGAAKSLGELVPCGGGPPIPLVKSKLLVGLHPACDIVLGFPSVSSRHCELEFRDGHWFVRDLGSRNGIRVDGERCESSRLMPHNVLWISTHRYRLSYTRPGERPSAEAGESPFGRSLLEKAGLVRRRTKPPARPTQNTARDRPPLRRRDDDEAKQRWSVDEDL